MIGASPAAHRRELGLLALAVVLAMAPWFSTAAVLDQLREAWPLTSGQASWLIIVVQIGFVLGAVFSSLTNLADRIPPRRLILFGAVGASVANIFVVIGNSFEVAIVARLLTGVSLAAVYPPALKAISSWYREGRGFALGVIVGALTLGSALPHLVNSIGGLSWQITLIIVSALTLGGGLIADKLCTDGPYGSAPAVFDKSQIKAILANRDFRLASAGYFGHMWELYAMWAWIAAFYGDVFDSDRQASFAAFIAIASGSIGSVWAGLTSDRSSRSDAAALAMRYSSIGAVFAGFLIDAPWPIVLGMGVFWGFWVVADSAQFSTIVTEVVDARYVGTALTIQLATGFVLTLLTIFLVPIVRDSYGWGWAFFLLAPGPALGAYAMRALRIGPKKPAEPEPEPDVWVSPFF